MIYGKLLLESPAGDQREFVLEKPTITLGRDADNDIVLAIPVISRHHARLSFSPEPLLEDLGSTFGTTVGADRITSRILQSGDVFALAGVRLRFIQVAAEDQGARTIVKMNVVPTDADKVAVDKVAMEATRTLSLLDVPSEVANAASRLDATLQVVIPNQAPRLIIREGNVSRDVTLGPGTVVLGRGSTSDVQLLSKLASRRHAAIKEEGGEYVITDLSSANGTLVNGHPLTAARRLVDGDTIGIGEATIIFRSGSHLPARAPRKARQIRRPVLFIPGLMGSELRQGSLLLWPNYPYLIAHPTAASPDSGPVEVTGVISEVIIIPYLVKLDAYNRLTSGFLEAKLGYHLGINLLEFPYDWRQDNRVIAEQLAQTVISWRTSMGHDPITIIAHSMGGLITRYFLDALGGREHVERFIVMGTPHQGTAKSLAAMLGGAGAGALSLAHDKVRTVALNGPSMYQILPRFPCVFTSRGQALDIFADQSWLPEEYRHYLANAREFTAALADHATVPTVCILGYGRPTLSRLIVAKEERSWRLLSYEMEPIGDGAVAEQSAVLNGADIHPVRQDHGALYTDPDVQRRLRYELLERR